MPVTDELLYANESYATRFELGHLAMPPARKLAIVACMDARLTVEEALGLKTGDAHIIRNAGGVVTDDVIRSLIISHHLLGTEEFVFGHTDPLDLRGKTHRLVATRRPPTSRYSVQKCAACAQRPIGSATQSSR